MGHSIPSAAWGRANGDCQVLKQSLTHDARLDEDMIGVDLTFDGDAVFERLAMKILITVAAAKWLHVLHPEMVGEGADQTHGLFEGVFDFEPQPIEANDLDGA